MNVKIQQRLDQLAESFQSARTEVLDIEAAWGRDPALMPAGQQERHERMSKAMAARAQEIEDIEAREGRMATARTAADDPRNVEGPGSGVAAEHANLRRNRSDPWADLGDNIVRSESPDGLYARAHDAIEAVVGLPHAGREMLAGLVDNPRERSEAADLVIAATDPHYRMAFQKIISNPQHGHLMWTAQEQMAFARTESCRAALSLTGANGGFLVPFTLDPTVVLTNAGAANPFRQISRIATTATNSWNGAASAGVSAQWLAEAGVAADATPTFSQLTITPQKAAAWVFGSYEVIQDSDIGSQLPVILADAKNVLENAAFATGAGSGGVPKGIVTAATTTLTTAAVATYAVADTYSLHQALPARARLGKSPAFVMSVNLLNKTRQFDTAGGSSYWVTLGDGAPPKLLGAGLYESSGMATTTTTGSKIAVYGDFDRYQIVDRVGMTVIYEPLLQDQATGRPPGQAGWFAYWRVGADALDPTAFRTLVVQ